MGETPNNAINRQQTMGIQALRHEILAVFAILKHGAAMSATTAGRTPLKNFSTHGLSLKLWKNMAMMMMAMMDGRAMPTAPTMPPHTPFSLYPICDAMSMAKIPGVDCATTMMSINSCRSIHLLLSTNSRYMIGIMA